MGQAEAKSGFLNGRMTPSILKTSHKWTDLISNVGLSFSLYNGRDVVMRWLYASLFAFRVYVQTKCFMEILVFRPVRFQTNLPATSKNHSSWIRPANKK